MTSRRGILANDGGASLILALIFITCVSLIVGGLLSYSSSGLKSAGSTQAAGVSTADVGSALQTGINDLRNSTYFNSPASAETCLGAGNLKSYTPTPSGSALTVTCAPDATSGGAGGLVPVNNSNKPALAVLTLASGSEVGLDKTGNRPLKIKGSVYSNSTIRASGGTACPTTWPPPANSTNCNGIFTQGPDANPDNVSLTGETGCIGTVVTRLPANKHCPASHATIGEDPANTYPAAYAQPTTGMTARSLPTCGSNPVTFDPGYYDDAVGLSQLTGGSGSCGGKTFWFKPGVYYFDFHNSDMPTSGSPVIPNGSNVWTFNDTSGVLVAGTKQGWTTSASKANMPGSCVSPLTSTTTLGVQFVFGGDSQLNISKGSAEICGTWYVDRPSLVLYGAKSTTGALLGPASLAPSSVTSTTNPAFTALTPGPLGSNTDAGAGPKVAGMAANKTATLQVNAFTSPSPAVAARAVLDQATVTVRHGELGANAATTLTLTLKPNRPGAAVITKPILVSAGTSSLTYLTQTLDVTSELQAEMYAYGLTNPGPFTAAVTVATSNTGSQSVTEQVDYLNISLSWRPIAVRKQSGCVALPSGCAMVQTDIHTDEVYFQGTAYTPLAWLDIRLVGVTGQVFRAGLVARRVSLDVSPSNGYDGPLIELPDNVFAPVPLRVYLTAWSCPGPGACTSPPSTSNGWRVVGRTLVEYADLNFVPVSGQRGVTVKSWRVARS